VLALAVPSASAQSPVTITGTVTDGSGHGWPLIARVQVGGQTVATDPATGHFSVDLVTGVSHDFVVSADGYETEQRTVVLAPNTPVQDFALVVAAGCAPPGYAVNAGPALIDQPFDLATTPAGWSVAATPTGSWRFDDPISRGNLTGGAGRFAIMDSDSFGPGLTQDSSLITPSVDMTTAARPGLSFNSDFRSVGNNVIDVDVTTNGGTSWTNLMTNSTGARGPRVETLPLTATIGQPSVIVRFRYRGTWAWWWQVDNVRITDPCSHVTGGMVVGRVTERASGLPIAGAAVAGPQGAAATTASDGWYSMFVTRTGSGGFTAAADRYVAATRDVDVVPDATVRRDFELDVATVPSSPVVPASVEPAVASWTAVGDSVLATRTDGSVRTLLRAPAAIDALAADGDALVLSFTRSLRLPGLAQRVDDSDLVRYAGGAYSLHLDGSDVGLTTAGEDVDAVETLPDGRILVSTAGRVRAGSLSGQDEDVLAFTPRTLGSRTAGRWRPYLDGGDVGLRARSEDVDGVAVDATGAVALSVRGRLGVPGLHAAAGDVATFVPSRLGRRTAGRFAPAPMLTGTAGDFDLP
jgi:hypothetical protein